MSRGDLDYADKYAFYLAYDQVCGYCGKHIEYGDVQIDHVLPQHLARDPQEWQTVIASLWPSVWVEVDCDGNRLSSRGQDNYCKSGELFPVQQGILLLRFAAKKAAHLATTITACYLRL
jgi:hypothetical protein